MNLIQQFAIGVVTICVIIMRGVGVIDDLFTGLMQSFGLYDPHWQLYILLALVVFYIVLAVRAVGGMVGWAMILFAVLLLLHHALPSLGAPGMPIATQLDHAL